jgi:hypothetical protein
MTSLVVIGVFVAAVVCEGFGLPLVAATTHWLPATAQPYAPWVSAIVRTARWPLLGSLLASVLALYGAARAARTERWAGIFAGIFCATAAILLALQQVVLPAFARYQSVRDFVGQVREVVGTAGEVSFYKTFDYEAVFYWHGHIPAYQGPWPEGAPPYLLVQGDEWTRMQAHAKGQYQEVTFPEDRGLGDHGGLLLIRRIEGH